MTCKHLRTLNIPIRESLFPFKKSTLFWCSNCGAIKKQGDRVWILCNAEAARDLPDPYIDVTNMPPRQLKDIQVDEVSFVPKGPQGKTFSFLKDMQTLCKCRICQGD